MRSRRRGPSWAAESPLSPRLPDKYLISLDASSIKLLYLESGAVEGRDRARVPHEPSQSTHHQIDTSNRPSAQVFPVNVRLVQVAEANLWREFLRPCTQWRRTILLERVMLNLARKGPSSSATRRAHRPARQVVACWLVSSRSSKRWLTLEARVVFVLDDVG